MFHFLVFVLFFCFLFLAVPCGLWDLSSLLVQGLNLDSGSLPLSLAEKVLNPNHWTTREFHSCADYKLSFWQNMISLNFSKDKILNVINK